MLTYIVNGSETSRRPRIYHVHSGHEGDCVIAYIVVYTKVSVCVYSLRIAYLHSCILNIGMQFWFAGVGVETETYAPV